MSYFGIPIRNGLPIGLGSVAPLASGGGSPFSPLSLFSGGTPGAWYDPSDLTTLFQDSAGTTPVTAVEQPVGLMLDKSQGLVLGPDVVINGDFSSSTGWSLKAGATISSGKLNINTTGDVFDIAGQTGILTQNRFYRVTVVCSSYTSGILFVGLGDAGLLSRITVSSVGTFTALIFHTSAIPDLDIRAFGSGGTGPVVLELDTVSVKELPGNHAFQATSASRPVLSARYNLLTRTEDLTNAAWTSTVAGSLVTSGATDPLGGSTAFTITATAPNGQCYQNTTFSAPRIASGWIRRRTGTGNIIFYNDSGAVGQNITSSVTSSWTYFTVSSSTSNGSWYLLLATSGDAVDVWHPQVVPTNQSSIPYQRVNTSTDYATTGFLPYLKFDGVDDSLSTNSISFTSTDKMSVFAGVRKLSDAARGMIAELSATSASNNGTFGMTAPNAASATYAFESKGTVLTDAVGTPFAAPITSVLSGLSAILTDANILRVNGVQADSDTGDQGTGNYGNYPLYVGRRGGSSLPFNGQLYSMIIVGKAVTAGELSSTETYVNQKTGAY